MKHFIYTAISLLLLITATACDKDKENGNDDQKPTTADRTILVYAVASNNLDYDLVQNKTSMLKGLENVNLDKNQFLLYEVNNKKDYAILWKAVRNARQRVAFDSVGMYDRHIFSTDPQRIREVIDDVKEKYPSVKYDLFLWSHATSWLPGNPARPMGAPVKRSFGVDNFDGKQDKADIPEIASAIPDGMFEMIWFDCCLMSNIESAYELRDKCDWLVAYPTEIYSEGLPYETVLPHLFLPQPDRTAAAKEVYDFYTNGFTRPRAVSVCVMDMSKIEALADACRKLYVGKLTPDVETLQKYSRPEIRLAEEMYDFRQFSTERAKLNGADSAISEFTSALDNFIVYKAISTMNFNDEQFDLDNCCGISCHAFSDSGSYNDEFYKTFAWYKKVY